MQKIKRAIILFSSNPKAEAKRKRIGHSHSQSQIIQTHFFQNSLQTILKFKDNPEIDLFVALDDSNLPLPNIDSNLVIIKQVGKDFHSRITNSFQQIFDKGYNHVVMIGNDTPDLTHELICESFTRLNNNNIVLGPSDDGGVYLMGLNGFSNEIFNNVRWLSSNVHNDLSSNSYRLGYSSHNLTTLIDIDDTISLKSWVDYTSKYSSKLVQLLLQFINRLTFVSVKNKSYRLISNHSKLIWQIPPPVC
jgi:glycosyltransferase A (GT-A) superfamily protein (DUF2064 family)